MSILSFDNTNARNYHAPALAVQLLSIVRHNYRSSATIVDRLPQLSIVRHARASEPLINNDNRCRWESLPEADSPTLLPCLIIIIIRLYFYTRGY
ncbi:hypothetical protein [Microcoleus sp. B13-B4]|uniref:hypothetical protein n=1 Tax=unclassified Microcoleus TaxID=2642155 RepID=UPI002FD60074